MNFRIILQSLFRYENINVGGKQKLETKNSFLILIRYKCTVLCTHVQFYEVKRSQYSGPSTGANGEEGNGTQLQYSCLENPMDGGAW